MKAAIIGASREALHTIKKAREHGLFILALDGDASAAGLAAADKGLVVDISDENAVTEALRAEKPDFLLTVPIGRYLTTTGAVNDALGLPGISRDMAELCTDKFKFHTKLNEMGLRKGRCYTVFGDNPALAYPAILKPRYGSGSRGIFMLSGREQLREALDKISGEPYVLEECVAGEEYGVDAAVTKQGFQMILLRKKINTPPPARQAVGYVSVRPEEPFWQQAWEYMRKAVDCLGLGECLLHVDLIRSAQGPFVIEMSARPSGHNLHNLFTPLCTGIDMAEEYIKYRMGQTWNFTPAVTRQAMIHYFDLQGEVMDVPTQEQVRQSEPSLIGWECHIRAGEELLPVSDGHSLMGRGYFILEGEEGELRDKVRRVKALFRLA